MKVIAVTVALSYGNYAKSYAEKLATALRESLENDGIDAEVTVQAMTVPTPDSRR